MRCYRRCLFGSTLSRNKNVRLKRARAKNVPRERVYTQLICRRRVRKKKNSFASRDSNRAGLYNARVLRRSRARVRMCVKIMRLRYLKYMQACTYRAARAVTRLRFTTLHRRYELMKHRRRSRPHTYELRPRYFHAPALLRTRGCAHCCALGRATCKFPHISPRASRTK